MPCKNADNWTLNAPNTLADTVFNMQHKISIHTIAYLQFLMLICQKMLPLSWACLSFCFIAK